jgi:dTMP kinase
LLIAIEGTDGAGKATQASMLAQYFRRQGKKVKIVSFPQYGKKSAAAVEAYLNGEFGEPREVGTYRAAIFYAVDRAAARQRIRSWLKNGTVVIADRYIASNWAFGGALLRSLQEKKKYWQWDADLEFGLFDIPKPDHTIVLAIPPYIARGLVLKKRTRAYIKSGKRDLHERDIQYQAQALRTYRQLVKFDPKIQVVECAPQGRLLSKQAVHREVLQAIGLRKL